MANFNPQEQQSLEQLLIALRGGLEPSTGYSMLQNVIGEQQQRMADRQERMGSLTDFLTKGASQGQTFQQSKILADVMTPQQGVPNQLQGALNTLYPQSPVQAQNAPIGGFPAGNPPPQQMVNQRMSPLMPTPQQQFAQMSPTEQMSMQSAQATQQTDAAFSSFMAEAQAARAGGIVDPNQFINQLVAAEPQYGAVLSSDPSKTSAILQLVFGKIAMSTGGIGVGA
jgi:hypothetical protein